MEVLHGNQTGSKHSRRHSDKNASGENRELNWGREDSDIALYPHSPLALADLLSSNGGYLDLVPQADEISTGSEQQEPEAPEPQHDDQKPAVQDNQTPGGPKLVSSIPNQKRARRNRRERCNLLTRHEPAELLKQCKKILVENALVKNKGDRQLYLAAGFVSWPDPNDDNIRQRAPLLLYPALLVRVPDESRYEIRLTGNTPEYNLALRIHAEQRFSAKLPDFDETVPLSDFFAQVAQSINKIATLELVFDIALGSAALFQETADETRAIALPDVPANFDIALAMSITGNKSLAQLNAVLQLIPDYSQGDEFVEPEPLEKANGANVANLRKYAARLAAEGLDHLEFKQLSQLPSLIGKWTAAVSQALNTRTISQVLNVPELSARELIRLGNIIELIDKAPNSVDQLNHAHLSYKNTTMLLKRAKHQAKLIEDELANLQTHFVLDKVPAKSQLLSLMSELGGTIDHDPDLVDADYFNARRQFMEFSIDKPANLTAEHRRLLSQLAKVFRFRELFVNNTEYRAALGPGYKGLRTDWDVLTQTSDYARELADVLESEMIASQVMRHWHEFRASYGEELETLQNAADACRRLLGSMGMHRQSQTAGSLITYSQLVASRLIEWRSVYGSVEDHADKTAAIVLSSFSGKSRDDVLVETQVDETRTRINKQLKDGVINRLQISETLQWLFAATQAAVDSDRDIDAIVEHLQIA